MAIMKAAAVPAGPQNGNSATKTAAVLTEKPLGVKSPQQLRDEIQSKVSPAIFEFLMRRVDRITQTQDRGADEADHLKMGVLNAVNTAITNLGFSSKARATCTVDKRDIAAVLRDNTASLRAANPKLNSELMELAHELV